MPFCLLKKYLPAVWMELKYEGEWIHVYVWLGPFAVHLQLSQHCKKKKKKACLFAMLFFFLVCLLSFLDLHSIWNLFL